MSRVLVTGGAGRLGRTVVAVLAAQGHDVVSADLAQHDDVAAVDAKQVHLDVTDGPATTALFESLRPDAVVHLAAIAVPFSRPETEIYRVNTGAAFSVIEASLASGARSLLVASSLTVYGYGAPSGWKPSYLPLDEEHSVAPWNGYAASKDAVERLIAMAVRRHGDKIRLGVFRPCYVIAPDEWDGAPTQQGHTVAERLAEPALSAVALFNYVDARDAGHFADAWLANAETTENGTTFLVGAADALATRPMSELVPHYLADLGDLASHLDDTQPLFDCSRARELLGWEAEHSWRTELPPDVLAGLTNG